MKLKLKKSRYGGDVMAGSVYDIKNARTGNTTHTHIYTDRVYIHMGLYDYIYKYIIRTPSE